MLIVLSSTADTVLQRRSIYNMNIFENPKVSHPAQLSYVRRYTLSDGNEAGIRVVELYSGRLRVLLNESRALDIIQLFHDGVNLSFLSKNGLNARPLPFLNRFEGGMVYTCGLDNVGGRDGYELHGTHHLAPARILCAECDGEKIVVRAQVEHSALFAEHLSFERTVTLPVGGEVLTIEDEIVNRAFTEAKYCLLYHINLGYPMLDAGAQIFAPAQQVIARDAFAQEGIFTRCEVPEPQAGLPERCYFLLDRVPHAELHNQTLGKCFTLDYSDRTLPAFIQWNSFACGDYALGWEPATTFLDDRFTYRTLAPGESVRTFLRLGAHNL